MCLPQISHQPPRLPVLRPPLQKDNHISACQIWWTCIPIRIHDTKLTPLIWFSRHLYQTHRFPPSSIKKSSYYSPWCLIGSHHSRHCHLCSRWNTHNHLSPRLPLYLTTQVHLPPLPTYNITTRSRSSIIKPVDRLNLHTLALSPIPKTHLQVLKDPHWNSAMHDEYNALIKNNTWLPVPRPPPPQA